MLLDISQIEKLFQSLEKTYDKARKNLGRSLTIVEKILFAHMEPTDYSKLVRNESNIYCKPDRVAMQDATAQMAILQFMSAGLPKVANPTTVHCDHLIQAQTGAEADLVAAIALNKEVYDFYYKKGKMDKREIYDTKIYNKRFTSKDKEEVDSNFAFRKKPMPIKIILLFVIMCILFVWFGYYNYQNEDQITPILFIIIFFFIAIAVHYNVKSSFYIFLLGLIVFTILIVSGIATKGINFATSQLSKKNNKANNNKSNNKVNKK